MKKAPTKTAMCLNCGRALSFTPDPIEPDPVADWMDNDPCLGSMTCYATGLPHVPVDVRGTA